jgi:hypothetical protein
MVPNGGGDGSSYALRVLRPQSDGSYLGAGKSATVEASGDQMFSTSLPIQVGDLVALDLGNGAGNGVSGTPFPGTMFVGWIPAVPEGMSDSPNPIFNQTDDELAFNATVQYTETPSGPGTGGGGTGTTPTSKAKCKNKKKHKSSAQSSKKKKCKKKKKH